MPLLIDGHDEWDPDAMRRLAADLEGELPKLNPGALEHLHEHCGDDLSELQDVLTAVIDDAEASAVRWNPSAGDNAIVAQLKELCEQMAERLGRDVAWSDADASRTEWPRSDDVVIRCASLARRGHCKPEAQAENSQDFYRETGASPW